MMNTVRKSENLLPFPVISAAANGDTTAMCASSLSLKSEKVTSRAAHFARVRRWLFASPERKRDIILLSYFLDMSDAEIAELLNVVFFPCRKKIAP